MDKIIIVESPSKSKTIATYLGGEYKVLSSKGHICDLATTGKGGLGIDIEGGFLPDYKYIEGKEALVKTLKKACKGNIVYLATDPDREGEAIAYHLARELNLDLKDKNRIAFHEITKSAVNDALLNPQAIDMKMVDSQESRRMIDRILGFKLSKLLQKKIGSKSAGRVQSAALLLIVDLEKEINAFVPQSYYEMEAQFTTFKLKLSELNGIKIDGKNRILDRTVLENLKARLLSFVVSDIQSKQVKKQSYPTYTTSTLQQDASIRLGYSPTKTMKIAQGLYEGKNIGSETVGLITYMRTDSTRLADSFVNAANDYIIRTYGAKYLGMVKNRAQKGMQDAHEGIRPTSITRTPEEMKLYLSDEEYKLYSLIYRRTLASLMAAATYNSTKIEFTNTDSIWTVSGSQLVFDGYLKVYGREADEENLLLPNFTLGSAYNANHVEILDKETQPKSRYTEASLIKDMEELGIGRPSTYAQTLQTLKEREYIKLEKKSILPTEQGMLTIDKLSEYFDSIINVKYTAAMESDLDKIASGELDKEEELNSFYNGFMPIFDEALHNMEGKYPIPLDEACPECGNPLVIRLGKYGEFVSCSNYPGCSYIKKEEEENNDTGILCPVCHQKNIVKRVAKSGKGKGNLFYACDNYPKCKTIYADEPTDSMCPDCGSIMLKDKEGNLYCSKKCKEAPKETFLCPECKKGHLVPRTALKGKNKGNTFYGCDAFPKCRTIIEDTPTHEVCKNCGSMLLLDKDNQYHCYRKCNESKEETTDLVLCPKCQKGHLVKRVALKGKNSGNEFYGCDNYPKCKTALTIEEYNKLLEAKE